MIILAGSMDPAYKIAWLLVILPSRVRRIFYLLIGGGRHPRTG